MRGQASLVGEGRRGIRFGLGLEEVRKDAWRWRIHGDGGKSGERAEKREAQEVETKRRGGGLKGDRTGAAVGAHMEEERWCGWDKNGKEAVREDGAWKVL